MNIDLLDLVQAPARQTCSLRETEHRPWPLPERGWFHGQTWERLLFMHWRVDADALRALLPEQLALDTHDGDAWLGVTPFRVSNFRLRGLPPLPVLSSFPEVNVRTYVTHEEKPGIWFFSLDAASPWGVEAARRVYHLPYHRARIRDERRGDAVEYSSARSGATLDVTYRATGPPAPAGAETLGHFLTERYCLYTQHRGELERAEIHHAPWRLQPAEAELRENTMSPLALEGDPLLHYSERQDVVLWSLEAVAIVSTSASTSAM